MKKDEYEKEEKGSSKFDLDRYTEEVEKYTIEMRKETEPKDYAELKAQAERLENAARNLKESFSNLPQK